MFLGDTLGFAILIVILLAAFALMSALPIQAALEAIFWLRDGEFMNYDWVDYLGTDHADRLTSSDFVGVNKIVHWILNSWISALLCIVGFLVFISIATLFGK